MCYFPIHIAQQIHMQTEMWDIHLKVHQKTLGMSPTTIDHVFRV